MFLMVNSTLGAGLLSFPIAYSYAGGAVQGLLLQAVFSLISCGSLTIIAYCRQLNDTKSYDETVHVFCGPVMWIISQIFLIIHSFGSDVTYLVIIGDQLTKIVAFTNTSDWYIDRKILMTLIACVCILPLCIPKQLKILSYSSILGGFAAVFISVTISSKFYSEKYTFIGSSSPYNWSNIQGALPIICFGLQCHIPSASVYGEVRQSNLKRCSMVNLLSSMISFTVYAVAGYYGFMTFGYSVKSDILLNYDPRDVFATLARAFIVLIMITSFAIYLFVGRYALMGLWGRFRRLTPAENHKPRRRVVVSVFWFFSSLGLALLFPNIGKALQFFGGVAAHFMFTFPGLFLIQGILYFEQSQTTFKKFAFLTIGAFYVFFGVAIFSQSLCYAIMDELSG